MRVLMLAVVVMSSACAVVKSSRAAAFGRAPAKQTCELPVLRGQAAGYEAVGSQVIEGTTFMNASDAEQIARAEGCAANADAVLLASEAYDNPDQPSQAVMVLLKKKQGAPVVCAPTPAPCAVAN